MPLVRDDVRASVERAGDEHWQALIRHHEDHYPRPTPTPGDVCREEAARLNALALVDLAGFRLVETRVRRVGEEVELTHRIAIGPDGVVRELEPFRNYAPEPQ